MSISCSHLPLYRHSEEKSLQLSLSLCVLFSSPHVPVKCGFGGSGHFMGVAARPMMGRSIIVLGRTVGRGPDIIIALLLYLSMNDTPCFECKCHIVLLKAVIAWHVEVGTLINSPPSMNCLLWWEWDRGVCVVLDDRFISSVDIILIETHCSWHNTQLLYNLKMSKCILTA